MGTWTGNNANLRRVDYLGKTVQKTYSIPSAANDNTGGTLTCTGLKIIDNSVVNVFAAATGIASTRYISGNTLVVAYSSPSAAHTVRVTVWGIKG